MLPAAERALRGFCRGRQAQAPTPDALLAREACYRALGEGFSHPALAARVDFQAWYSSELRGLLAVRRPARRCRMSGAWQLRVTLREGVALSTELQSSGETVQEVVREVNASMWPELMSRN